MIVSDRFYNKLFNKNINNLVSIGLIQAYGEAFIAWCIKTSVNGSKENLQIEKDLIKAKKMTYDLTQNHLKMDNGND